MFGVPPSGGLSQSGFRLKVGTPNRPCTFCGPFRGGSSGMPSLPCRMLESKLQLASGNAVGFLSGIYSAGVTPMSPPMPPGTRGSGVIAAPTAADPPPEFVEGRRERLVRARRHDFHRRERRERREFFPNHDGHETDRVWDNRPPYNSSLRSVRSLRSISHFFVHFMVAVSSVFPFELGIVDRPTQRPAAGQPYALPDPPSRPCASGS